MASPNNYMRPRAKPQIKVLIATLALGLIAALIALLVNGELLGLGDVVSSPVIEEEQPRTSVGSGHLSVPYPLPVVVKFAPADQNSLGGRQAYPEPPKTQPEAPDSSGTFEERNLDSQHRLTDTASNSDRTFQDAVKAQYPNEKLGITYPADTNKLCAAFTVRGTATGLIPGQLALILVQAGEAGKIYPQGPIISNQDGSWEINIVGLTLGQIYTLTPVLPHGEALAIQNAYLETGRTTGIWPGLDDIGADANLFESVSIKVAPTACAGVEDYSPPDDTEYNGYRVIGS